MIATHPLVGIAIACAAFGGLLCALGFLQRRETLAPEVARKAFHAGIGLVALALPLLFRDPLPVWIVCAGAAATLAVVRWNRRAHGTFGAVLHAVERRSFGEFYFAAAIAIVFTAYHDRSLFYAIPIATLTFADTAAALVGSRFGTRRYRTVDGRKSLEGSLAFFAVAFACASVPLAATHATSFAAAVIVGLIFAALATWMEAMCWHGGDNIGIPLVGSGVLAAFVHEPLSMLLVRAGILLAISAGVVAVRRRTTLGADAVMAALVFGYTFWVWGGLAYLVPPAILFAFDAFATFTRPRDARHVRPHRASAIVAACGPGLIWAFATQLAHGTAPAFADALYAGFLATFGAELGIFQFTRSGSRTGAVCTAALACAPVAFFIARDPALTAVVFVTTFAATTFFARLQPGAYPDCPRDGARWCRQAGLASASSLGAFALIPLLKG